MSDASAKDPNPNTGAARLAVPMELDYNSSDEDYKNYAKATQETTKDISERMDGSPIRGSPVNSRMVSVLVLS
uniref:Uncharacterized protein n=1 Tax=Sphaerodactylus townsendi TaxID=933632 RepID=A0ACB8E693_9SAUR